MSKETLIVTSTVWVIFAAILVMFMQAGSPSWRPG